MTLIFMPARYSDVLASSKGVIGSTRDISQAVSPFSRRNRPTAVTGGSHISVWGVDIDDVEQRVHHAWKTILCCPALRSGVLFRDERPPLRDEIRGLDYED
jgi:hypothetical protein